MSLKLDGAGSLNRQVYRAVLTAIDGGVLRQGERLWSSRVLQLQLGVSRNVILMAVAQLTAEGYLEARRGAGTYVNARPLGHSAQREITQRSWALAEAGSALQAHPPFDIGGAQPQFLGREFQYDFRYARTHLPAATRTDWMRLERSEARSAFERCGACGHAELQRAVAAYLRRSRSVIAAAADVLITSGAQEALDLTARLFIGRRTTVIVEDPHYLPFSMLAVACGARIHKVAVDEHGIDVAALPVRRGALICLTPNHQFPSGAVLSLERRHALLRWAERCDALIVEDDYDGEFRYDSRPLPPLKQLDTAGRVIYVGSMSKALSPALRLGYAVVPPGSMHVYRRFKELSSGGCAVHVQKTLAQLIQRGLFERHLRRVRRVYAERRAALVAAIERHLKGMVSYHGSCAGLHLLVWVHSVRAVRWREFLLHASRKQIAVFAATSLFARTPRSLPLVLAYGGIDTAAIEPGIRTLAEVIRSWSDE
jgi:GntR family transcriptional regulator/MocR family aminotransferase